MSAVLPYGLSVAAAVRAMCVRREHVDGGAVAAYNRPHRSEVPAIPFFALARIDSWQTNRRGRQSRISHLQSIAIRRRLTRSMADEKLAETALQSPKRRPFRPKRTHLLLLETLRSEGSGNREPEGKEECLHMAPHSGVLVFRSTILN